MSSTKTGAELFLEALNKLYQEGQDVSYISAYCLLPWEIDRANEHEYGNARGIRKTSPSESREYIEVIVEKMRPNCFRVAIDCFRKNFQQTEFDRHFEKENCTSFEAAQHEGMKEFRRRFPHYIVCPNN
jgi:hypothetical protein